MKSIFHTIWVDTVGFVESVLKWIEKEAEDFWNNGGSVVAKEILSLAESAFTAWVATQPESAIFAEFEGFAITYIKDNWKKDLGLLEDAVAAWALGMIGIKYKIPSTPDQNGGTLIGGTQQGG